MSAAERRILFTKWYCQAWFEFTNSEKGKNQITNSFKQCGLYNDIHGKENHRVKVRKLKSKYVVPRKTDPPAVNPNPKTGGRKRKHEDYEDGRKRRKVESVSSEESEESSSDSEESENTSEDTSSSEESSSS